MSHMARVVPMLHLLGVNVHSLLGGGKTGLRGLRVWAWGHRGWGGCKGRVHLLLWRVAQVHGLGWVSRPLVLGMLNRARGRVAASMLGALLRLSCRGGRGLRVLRVVVQGGARVGKLLRNRSWRH